MPDKNRTILWMTFMLATLTVATGGQAGDLSSIWIVADDISPVELLVTDHQGRRTGFDPSSEEPLREIPNSAYFAEYIESPDGSGGMGSKQMEIRQPMSGDYVLRVTSAADGLYNLSIYCQDSGGGPFIDDFDKAPISTGAVHSFILEFDKTSSEKCTVTGGFDGGGEQPTDVNRLLSYVNITKAKTRLPPGADSTDLFIIYGDAVIAESFTAKLNGQDISGLFTPVAGGHEIVKISLQAGENVLVLEVMGAVTRNDATDTDRLVFVVR